MTTTIFRTSDLVILKQKVLNWIQRFNTFSFLDNHSYPSGLSTQEILVGAGSRFTLKQQEATGSDAFRKLDDFTRRFKGEWIFGHLGYEFGSSPKAAGTLVHKGFDDICFFVPEIVMRLNESGFEISANDPDSVYNAIMETQLSGPVHAPLEKPFLQGRLDRETYIATIRKLQEHILRGDCYEINFCQEFFAENASIDPVETYLKLAAVSPAPFAGLYRVDEHWLACASPERYIKKTGGTIFSQPIKGTAKREPGDSTQDAEQANLLYHSAKDRSENVMIVDLVRNDFSKFCREGSVRVDELYGIYIFPQVYQMISTISGELRPGTSFAGIIEASFPMGSMTGAPKKRVMELIEQYEQQRRGLFSGTIGYIAPDGDFDFNVVIRSVLYDARQRYLSLPAGSGITFYSDPALEWEECLVKAAAMRQVFE